MVSRPPLNRHFRIGAIMRIDISDRLDVIFSAVSKRYALLIYKAFFQKQFYKVQ
ncbi:hypothetical protein D3C85_1678000 [compost metagenome]